MNEPWYPGAVKNPGNAAGYAFNRSHPFGFADGHSLMQAVKCHYTVGRDSTGRGVEGYFQFLVARDGTIQQFCEADAYCWDSGEENKYGPGIEIEYLDEPEIFTDAALTATAGLVHWLNSEWGVPLTYHDGAHDVELGGGYRGFISHHALIQTEQHSDFWPPEAWARIVGEAPVEPVKRFPIRGAPEMAAYRENKPQGGQRFWFVDSARPALELDQKRWEAGILEDGKRLCPVFDVTTAEMESIKTPVVGSGGSTGGTLKIELVQ